MLALPQEYVASICEIKSMNNDLLAVGRVIKIDSEALEVAAQEGEHMPLLQYRAPVKLFVHNARQGTRILVGVAYLSTENFARVEEVKPLQDFERRAAFRVNTDVTGKMVPLPEDEQDPAYGGVLLEMALPELHEAVEETSFTVQVLDISLTGLRLFTKRQLNIGERYNIEFDLLKLPMRFCVRVQRLIQTTGGDVQFGCIFFDFSERQMDMLWKQLFQLQRIEKSKRRTTVL